MLHEGITGRIIGCAIEVHRELGPGLLESIYEEALSIEMELQGLRFERQQACSVFYKGKCVGDHRLDLLVEDAVVVEIKSVQGHDKAFDAQILNYMRITKKQTGLLVNFGKPLLKEGIKHYAL